MSITTDSKLATGEDILSRVSELAVGFRERSAITNGQRSVPRDSIDELIGAGVARLLVPREHGGLDLKIRDMMEVTAAAARGCPSTGWCTGLMAHVSHVIGRFPLAAQQAVWADGPDVIMASSFMGAKAQAAPGGYRVSGVSPFSSGVNHADWVYLGGMVSQADRAPEPRLFLVSKDNYTVKDTWHTAGMRGTGSNTVITDDVFVPEDFTVSLADAREGTAPGSRINANPTFRLPWVATGALAFNSAMLGAAEGAYAEVVESLKKKRSAVGQRAADSEAIQIDVSFAAGKINLARRTLQHLADRADLNPDLTMHERASMMRDGTLVAMLLVETVDTLVEVSGTAAFGVNSAVQRAWRDVHFAAAHQGLNKRATGGRFGRLELDVEDNQLPLFY